MSLKRKPKKRLIGYARVSTTSQKLKRQVDALKAAGCSRIFRDKASGASTHGRPQLEKALAELDDGVCLVVAEWDRATRSMWDGLKIVQQVIEVGGSIKVLDFPSLDLDTPEGQGFLAMFSAMAERERQRIVARTHEGRRMAKAAGVKMGRKPKLTPHQQRKARDRRAAGETCAAIARDFAVSHSTIARLG